MPRGRPPRSQVRQNIIEIVSHAKKAHGYRVYSIYKDIFPKVTMRAIYYHLRKGLETGEFKIAGVEKEKGNYSWGGEVERTYYELGENAAPKGNPAVKEYFDSRRAPAERKGTPEQHQGLR